MMCTTLHGVVSSPSSKLSSARKPDHSNFLPSYNDSLTNLRKADNDADNVVISIHIRGMDKGYTCPMQIMFQLLYCC